MRPASRIRAAKPAWKALRRSLTQCFDALGEDEVLIISHRGSNRYVQFAAMHDGTLLAESTSNVYIEPSPFVLTDADFAALEALGWRRPTINPPETYAGECPSGSPNFHTESDDAGGIKQIARLAIRTLRDVYGIAHPRDLEYSAFHADGTVLRFPTLGIRARRPQPAELEDPTMVTSFEVTDEMFDDLIDE